MEDQVKTKTSNTNMKPLQLGKETFDSTRAALDQFKTNITTKRARFVLHPVLTQILEDIEKFTLGQTLIMENEGTDFDGSSNADEAGSVNDEVMVFDKSKSKDPLRTSFIRSNTSKLIQTGSNGGTQSRLGVKDGVNRSSTVKSIVGNQSTSESTTSGLAYRTGLVEKKSKLISIGSKTNDTLVSKYSACNKPVPVGNGEGPYSAIAGLSATLAERPTTAPLPKYGLFIPKKKDETDAFQFQFRNTLVTKKHDTGCYVTGMTTLQCGSIIVADGVHDSLQLFNDQLQLVSETEIHHPWGVCEVSDTAVAVSLHYDHVVALVNADNVLEKVSQKNLSLHCKASLMYDLKCSSYRLHVLCSDGHIHVLDLKGKEYSVVKTYVASSLRYLDIDEGLQMIAVSGETVVALYTNGQRLWQFKTAGRSKMLFTGVFIQNGRVFVCDWENYRVAEVCGKGTHITPAIVENIDRPVSMSLDRTKGLLLVSQGDYNMEPNKLRQIKIFQLYMK